MATSNPVLLLILDGWGVAAPGPGNAFTQAHTPHLDHLCATAPHTTLRCMGPSVGLPDGQMGNSEVGHLNLGAGRIVYQDIMRINRAISDASFYTNPVLNELTDKALEGRGRVHLMGLVSDGGVHSNQDHLNAMLELCRDKGLKDVFVHVFLDGRDTPPASGLSYVDRLQKDMERIGVGQIATLSGRFYAMDRDKRWDRVKLAYDALTLGQGIECSDPAAAIRDAYAQDENDEFIRPRVVMQGTQPVATIEDDDVVFFFNFRADRARELTRALFDSSFDAFARTAVPTMAYMATMTMYEGDFGLPVAFPPVKMTNILGEMVAKTGAKQFRIAETEKYAHVTYFFNGGREEPFEGEDRKLVPSPREVATYDLKPEMSVHAVAAGLCEQIASGTYALIVCNFANLDMVGHTGIIPAAITACEAVDECVGKVVQALETAGGVALLTADHGNAEDMLDADGKVKTSHSLNPVPCLLLGKGNEGRVLRKDGALCDVAPTLLELMGIKEPEEMTGTSLLAEVCQ